MEEIDGIIIQSLRNLHCNIDEDIHSLKQFDPDAIVNAVSSCLEAIVPGSSFPHKLPPSMTLRLKTATALAEQIKDLGFRGDMGYQSILYSNETEIRRVLMFLIERLPRESSKVVINEEIGYVPRLVKEIELRIKMGLEKPWVPSDFLYYGSRNCGNKYLKHSFGYGHPLHSQILEIPNLQESIPEDLKSSWLQNLPFVSQQCSQQSLIPSLLFNDAEFEIVATLEPHIFTKVTEVTHDEIIPTTVTSEIKKLNPVSVNEKECETLESKNSSLIEQIQVRTEEISGLQHEIKEINRKLNKIKTDQAKEEEIFKELENKVQIKRKTLTVLSKEENMAKLKGLIEKGTERLVSLAEQWDKVQKPLLQEYQDLQKNISTKESEFLSGVQQLESVQETNKHLIIELKDKECLELQLIDQCEKLNKNTNRTAYTKRILEIIGNIKKQNEEIQKVLKDTREVQKEINTLNGQVDRSFTLADELIFRDARREEMSRKAYKMLAALHSECGNIIKAAAELGQIERESRNLEEQIDSEIAKETATKLDRVLADIKQVKMEIGSATNKC